MEDLTTGEHSDVSLAHLRRRPAVVNGTYMDVGLDAVRTKARAPNLRITNCSGPYMPDGATH